jgi:Flp pilus assembly protein TadD
MQAARCAYAKALHAAPNRGAYWGDLASSLYLESQLRRAHSKLRPDLAPALSQEAERLLRGALHEKRTRTISPSINLPYGLSCWSICIKTCE